ncbi:uncharacterized protein [Euwallacea similis]|uniref:uncharacterized protein n=1 Tax=Euwallacea similis TaxID=1736056 RepID=UPI00344CFE51
MPRHNDFSFSEMRDMICVFAQLHFNGRAAARSYFELYPNRQQPNHKLFRNLYNRLGETGSFRPQSQNNDARRTIPVEQEEEVLVRIAENKTLSTRRLSATMGMSQSSVWRILHKEKFHPYHLTPVQNLLVEDRSVRLRFAQFLQEEQNEDPNFLNKILFTDEATFARRGIFNWKSSHLWDFENPNAVRETHFQHEFKINIWCGVIGDFFIGPFELPANLNGLRYLNFLQGQLNELLEDVPLYLRQNMWFMQDRAAPHFSLQGQLILAKNYAKKFNKQLMKLRRTSIYNLE